MIGGLIFTSAASSNFGVNIKTWRLFADASNDVGLALEMLAPLPAFRQGGRFLRLICLASVFKAACGVAAGATTAAITEHWAVDNNIADVGAKVTMAKIGSRCGRSTIPCLYKRVRVLEHCGHGTDGDDYFKKD